METRKTLKKAIEIYDLYWDISPYSLNVEIVNDDDTVNVNHNREKHAKECAMICIEQTIKVNPNSMFWGMVKIDLDNI